MITTSPSITHISKALLIFQGAVEGVGKSKNNEFFKSKYATLENVRDTAVPELQTVGVFYIQSPGAIVEGSIGMTTRLIHAESGEWIEGNMDIPIGKKDPQGAGSAITYASRYHLMAMLGLPAVDDDAETAIDRNDKRKESTPKPTEQPKTIERMAEDNPKAIDLRQRLSDKLLELETPEAIEKFWSQKTVGDSLASLPKQWNVDLVATKMKYVEDMRAAKSNNKAGSFKPVVAPDFSGMEPNDIPYGDEERG